jgi:hypothetical protein
MLPMPGSVDRARDTAAVLDERRRADGEALNIIFLILAAFLIVVFFRTGSGGMLRMMGGTPGGAADPA